MSDTDDLDDILEDPDVIKDDAKAAEPEPEEDLLEPEPKAEATTEDAPEDTGEKAAEAPPAPQEQAKQMVPLAALDDERSKRREYEDRVRNLEAEIAAAKVAAQQQRQTPQEQPKAPDPWDDPAAAIKHAVQEANQQFAQRSVAMSIEHARAQFPDYDEVIADWGKAVAANPALDQTVMANASPGLAAYNAVKQYRAQQEIGDPAAFKQRLEAEIRASIAAEQDPKPAPQLPQSMAGGANVGDRSGPKWSGPETLDELLPE